jgi:hypothetical protein
MPQRMWEYRSMLSRTHSFFFEPSFDFGVDNVFTQTSDNVVNVPPVAGDFLLLNGTDFLLLDGTNFLLL